MNQACLLKISWALRAGEENLWTQVLKGKNGRSSNFEDALVLKPLDSTLRKVVASYYPFLKENEMWAIGNKASMHGRINGWISLLS